MGYYGQGDFYGAGSGYYRSGDPGFFDFLGGVGKSIFGGVKSILPALAPIAGTALLGPVGGVVGGALGTALAGRGGGAGQALAGSPGSTSTGLAVKSQGLSVPTGPAAAAAVGKLKNLAGKVMKSGVARKAAAGALRLVTDAAGNQVAVAGHRRRMNPCNPRALRRALRRAQSFEHFARGVIRITHPHKGRRFVFKRRKRRT